MIEFENVTRKYGQKVAVSEFNLMVPEGELFALLGPNGAGKTTTIKMLVGLLRPSTGTVRIGGFDVSIQVEGLDKQAAGSRRCLELFEDFCVVTASIRQGIPVNVQVVDESGERLF